MAKLADGFHTASLSAENVQLSDTAISAIAKALTTSEGGITPTVVNNYFDNSTVSQSTSGGVTNISTTLDSKNNQRQKINNN